jgi:hypothetical protein
MWFLYTIIIPHPPREINIEEFWQPQWTYNYTFAIDKPGEFKLALLLFTTPTSSYNTQTDYHEIANQILKNAYRENHLWITVQ